MTPPEALRRIEACKKTKSKELDLRECELYFIPQEINDLVWLERLYISDNKIIAITGLENLVNLSELYLDRNIIDTIEGLEKLVNLSRLRLSDNLISDITGLKNLLNLSELYLDKNVISAIEGLENLVNLSRLDIDHNQISTITGLENLGNLKELYFTYNQISVVSGLEGLTNLSILSLNNNRISTITGIRNLVNLSRLYLAFNQISTITGLENLIKLSVLFLSGNIINSIAGLDKLLNLSVLSLNNNKINYIAGLDNLVNLTELSLSHNQISEISGLEKLVKLEELYLSHNDISEIAGLTNFKKLFLLYLDNNQISTIGGLDIRLLEKLKTIDLSGNPIQDIPSNDLDNVSAILGYLKSKAENENLLNKFLKINIIGEGRIGKTQLFHYLRGNKFITNEKETHGTNTANYQVPNSDHKATVWDFGGQAYHHGFHQIFLGRTDFNIVLWRNQKDKKPDYGYWLGTARTFASDKQQEHYVNPLLLVQNVWQTAENEPNFVPDQVYYPDSSQMKHYQLSFDDVFVIDVKALFDPESSYQTKHNYFLTELHQRMITHASKLEIPTKWVNIKNKLDEHPIKEINVKKREFRDNWANDITDHDKFEGLLAYLEFTGNILSFRENEALKDYVFPDPPFLSDWLYNKVLGKQSNGKISKMELSQKLTSEEVTIFLELMDEFKLIFEQPHFDKQDDRKDTYYIVPQFLPEYEHSFKQVLLELLPFTFALQFPDFVHQGRIFQFIAQYGKYAKDNTAYWRYGLLYEHPVKNGSLQVLVYFLSDSRQLMVHIQDRKGRSEVAREIFDYFVFEVNSQEQKSSETVGGHGYTLNERREIIKVEKERKRTFTNRKFAHTVYLSTQAPYYFDVVETHKNIEAKNFYGQCLASQKRIKLDFMAINLLSNDDKKKLRVFFSYSHKDEVYRNELEVHMTMLKRSGRIETWHDRKIIASENWDDKIKEQLQQADIVLLMISSDFLNSDYIWEQELGIVRERYVRKDGIKIIPIFTRPCDTKDLDFMALQGGQRDHQSKLPWISSSSDRDQVYTDIVSEIRKAIEL